MKYCHKTHSYINAPAAVEHLGNMRGVHNDKTPAFPFIWILVIGVALAIFCKAPPEPDCIIMLAGWCL